MPSFRQPLLSQTENRYDELSRQFERNDRLFDYRDQGVDYQRPPELTDGPLGVSNDGLVVTRSEYDRNSRRTFVIEDDLDTFQTRYDGVNRVIERIDPEENRVQSTYDDNRNLVKVIEIEVTQPDAVAAGQASGLQEIFTTLHVYDSLNRRIRSTDNLGHTVDSPTPTVGTLGDSTSVMPTRGPSLRPLSALFRIIAVTHPAVPPPTMVTLEMRLNSAD